MILENDNILLQCYNNIVEPFPKPPPCPPDRNIAAYTTFVFCRTCNVSWTRHIKYHTPTAVNVIH